MGKCLVHKGNDKYLCIDCNKKCFCAFSDKKCPKIWTWDYACHLCDMRYCGDDFGNNQVAFSKKSERDCKLLSRPEIGNTTCMWICNQCVKCKYCDNRWMTKTKCCGARICSKCTKAGRNKTLPPGWTKEKSSNGKVFYRHVDPKSGEVKEQEEFPEQKFP